MQDLALARNYPYPVNRHYGLEDREEILNPLAGSSLRQGYGWQAIFNEPIKDENRNFTWPPVLTTRL